MKWSLNVRIASLKNSNGLSAHPATALAIAPIKEEVPLRKPATAQAAVAPRMKYRDMKGNFKTFPNDPS
jgi:hypothetical protein